MATLEAKFVEQLPVNDALRTVLTALSPAAALANAAAGASHLGLAPPPPPAAARNALDYEARRGARCCAERCVQDVDLRAPNHNTGAAG